MRIATLPIGYADGYNRRFGNGVGKVKIANQLLPVIGNVCMDMCMVDLGEVEAQEGDEVCIFGQNPDLTALAQSIGTIPYELLTSVSSRVKRIYIQE
jgi:alanine racemase